MYNIVILLLLRENMPSSTALQSTQTLKLQRANGEKVELTPSRLEQLLAQAELSLERQPSKASKKVENAKELATQFLSRFGLQTPLDVIMFLESPEGEAIVALIEEELAELASIERHVQQEQLEHQLHKHLLIAFFLMGMLHKHAAHAHQRHDSEIAAAEKKLHEKTQASEAPTTERIEHDYDAYTSASGEIEKRLHNQHHASKQLEQLLAALKPQHQATESKYALFHQHLDDALKSFLTHANKEQDPTVAMVKGIDEKIKILMSEIDLNIGMIDQKLVENQDEDARALMNVNNAKNLQIAALKEILAVAESQGDKVIYNDKFEPAKSFDEAAYILSKGVRIAEENGIRYLLKEGQTIDSLSPEEKADAEKQYKQLKPTEVMSVRQLVKHNHQLENAKYNSLSAQSEQMQQDIILLTNQLAEMQESRRTKAEMALRPTPSSAPTLKMTPVRSGKSKFSLDIEEDFQESYKHVLELMHENPSARAIEWVKQVTARMNPSTTLKLELNKLKPGMPIPETTMKALLAVNNVGRAWQDVSAPDVQKRHEIHSAPNPFKMTRGG